MRYLFTLFIILSFVFSYTNVEAKMGFGKSSSFRSYKSFKYSKQKTIKQTKKDFSKGNYKQKNTKIKRKPPILNNPIFKWLIGGMIFGALISFLLGYGFHIGMPGLLEILLIIGVVYFFLQRLKKNHSYKEVATNEGITLKIDNQQKKEEKEQINEIYLKNIIKNMYLKLQEEWSKGNLSSVKDYFTDKLYNHLEMQLLDFSEKGLKNIVKDVSIKNIDIIHVEDKNDKKVVVAEIDAEMIDYTEDIHGNIVSGNPDTPKKTKEYWTIVGKTLNWKLDEIRHVEG